MSLEPGVYRHYKDGRYYLLLFVALNYDEAVKDAELHVWACPGPDTGRFPLKFEAATGGDFYTSKEGGYGRNVISLFHARSHGELKPGQVCVYVPLYADKPGRRISVRPVAEWTESVEVERAFTSGTSGLGGRREVLDTVHMSRFTYVGQTVPQDSRRSHDGSP